MYVAGHLPTVIERKWCTAQGYDCYEFHGIRGTYSTATFKILLVKQSTCLLLQLLTRVSPLSEHFWGVLSQNSLRLQIVMFKIEEIYTYLTKKKNYHCNILSFWSTKWSHKYCVIWRILSFPEKSKKTVKSDQQEPPKCVSTRGGVHAFYHMIRRLSPTLSCNKTLAINFSFLTYSFGD